jgi:DNA-binding PucR family transcriptional regulator
VISAVPFASPVDEQLLRGGAASLARACAARTPPLAVVRQDEIVVVVATDGGGVKELKARLEDALQRLAAAGLPLVVGVSTVVGGSGQIPEAYREATLARVTRDSRPGIASLAGMSAFEYLTLRPDPTAHRLIAPAIHEFVAQDAEDGAPLVATLRAYVACDLNVRRAAEQLHVHVNTAHYRLARIAERTGCDLRRIEDLMEVLIAARLADAGAAAPART